MEGGREGRLSILRLLCRLVLSPPASWVFSDHYTLPGMHKGWGEGGEGGRDGEGEGGRWGGKAVYIGMHEHVSARSI